LQRAATHDLGELVGLSGLKAARVAATAADPKLDGDWGIAKEWSEHKRYHRILEVEARDLYDAVSDATHGVFQWIKKQW
jgi:hypothetical protein